MLQGGGVGTKGHRVTRPESPLSEGSATFRMQFGPEAIGPCRQVVLWDFSYGGQGAALAGEGPYGNGGEPQLCCKP